MMRSWRIFFSRGIPKRNFDIRRFDSHHQFHSFFHLNDHHYQWSINTRITSVSLLPLQRRLQTTNINRGGVSKGSSERPVFGIDEQLQRLNENMKKREFKPFEMNLINLGRSRAVLTQKQSQQLVSTLKEWNKDDHSDQEYANVLRSLSTLQFSVTNKEHQEIIIALTERFLMKNQHSIRWFALFLTGLRGLKYSGSFMNDKHRRRILDLLSELKDDAKVNTYSELLSGIVGVGIRWDEINEAGKRNLLNQLKVLESKLTVNKFCTVVFNFGKLGVKLKESPYKTTILELIASTLKEIENDNGQGKLNLPRTVSYFRLEFASSAKFLFN
jgi:hypothetical protein